MQFRVPVDDKNTLHVSIYIFRAANGAAVPQQNPVPYYYNPLVGEDGRFITDVTFNQDYMAWVSQGPVARRDLEKLGESDKGNHHVPQDAERTDGHRRGRGRPHERVS